MSTKTNFKRIALVAVAALGLGVLSSIPSQALVQGTPTVTVVNGTATVQASDSTTAATLTVKYFSDAGTTDTATVSVTMGSKPSGATHSTSNIFLGVIDTALATNLTTTARDTSGGITVGGYSVGATARTAAADSGTVALVGNAAGFTSAKIGFQLDSAVARVVGTYTMNYVVKFYEASSGLNTTKTQTGTFDIVVTNSANAATGAVASSGTSTAYMYAGTSYVDVTGNVDSTVSVVSTPDGTVRAVIRVTLKTSAGLPARESLTVTTNIGNVGSDASTSGKSVTIVGNADGVNDIKLYSDGSGGTATITIKSTSVTFANKSATFYGTTVSTIAVTQLLTTLGSASASVLVATPKDAAGANIRAADAVYVYSDTSDVINTGTAPAGTSCGSYNSTYGGYLCQVAGSNNGTAKLTVRDKSTTTLSTVASTAVSVKVNTSAPASVSLAFDKATYAPGEKAYIIIKPLDSAKAAVGGATFANLFATGGITANVAFGNGSAATTDLDDVSITTAGTVAAIDGYGSQEAVKLYTVYMPASGGTVTITAKGGASVAAAGQVTVTASATVTDNGAAALAAVNALATTVASLKTLITTLTNLVLKIQKKVKA